MTDRIDSKTLSRMRRVLNRYDPNQPRDPKGTSTGGQWTSERGTDNALQETFRDALSKIQKRYKGDLSNVTVASGENSRGAAGHIGEGEKVFISSKGNVFESEEEEKKRLEGYIKRYKRRLDNADLTSAERDRFRSEIRRYEDMIKNYVPYTVPQSQEEIYTHEIAHVIQGQLQAGEVGGITDLLPPSKNPKPYKETLFSRFTKMKIDYPVSEYGGSSFDEYFAESFVLYMRGKSDKIHPDLLNLFERAMK